MKNRHQKITWEKFEWLQKYLQGEKIFSHTEDKDDYDFWRSFKFNRLGAEYKLEWWKNLTNVYIGEAQAVVTHFSIDGCWPNKYKTNLNFGKEEETLLIIPIEKWEK